MTPKSTLILSAHGTPKNVIEDVKSRGAEVIDATCPYVTKIHKIAGESFAKSCKLLVAGDESHTEVKGIVGHFCAKADGIDNIVFERIKKKHLGRYLNSFNSVSTPADMQADFFMKGFNVFDLAQALQNTTIEHVNERLINCFAEDNFCLSVIEKE